MNIKEAKRATSRGPGEESLGELTPGRLCLGKLEKQEMERNFQLLSVLHKQVKLTDNFKKYSQNKLLSPLHVLVLSTCTKC